MKSQTKNSIEYWKLIRIGKAKKILEDFNGAIEAYSKAIEIIKNFEILSDKTYCRLSLPFTILFK